jgi:diguanylate cyclase (GGDEF)-like protein
MPPLRLGEEGDVWRGAQRDSLTNLPSRLQFNEQLSALTSPTGFNGEPFTVGIIDIDRFKTINDLFGYDEGDAFLKQVSRRLETAIAPYGMVARLGEDEFAVLFTVGADVSALHRATDALFTAMAEPFLCGETRRACTMSLGLASFPGDAAAPSELLKSADLALYCAKKQGGNRCEHFERGLRTAIETRKLFHRAIETALACSEFQLVYQPIVSFTKPGKISFEALLRWQHPQRGLLSPASFSDVFDDPRAASRIGKWVIDHALGQAGIWQLEGSPFDKLAINVTSADFAIGGFAEFVESKLRQHDVSPQRLCIEVTERVFLDHGAAGVAEGLKQLHGMGVEIALDDFGTGYASLSHVTRFPIDRLKVDRSFVRDIEARHDDLAVALSIIQLGQCLGIDVTAEGVETMGQLTLLRRMGCDCFQGYLFSKPLDVSDIQAFIAALPA